MMSTLSSALPVRAISSTRSSRGCAKRSFIWFVATKSLMHLGKSSPSRNRSVACFPSPSTTCSRRSAPVAAGDVDSASSAGGREAFASAAPSPSSKLDQPALSAESCAGLAIGGGLLTGDWSAPTAALALTPPGRIGSCGPRPGSSRICRLWGPSCATESPMLPFVAVAAAKLPSAFESFCREFSSSESMLSDRLWKALSSYLTTSRPPYRERSLSSRSRFSAAGPRRPEATMPGRDAASGSEPPITIGALLGDETFSGDIGALDVEDDEGSEGSCFCAMNAPRRPATPGRRTGGAHDPTPVPGAAPPLTALTAVFSWMRRSADTDSDAGDRHESDSVATTSNM
mmetsp:Transcript_22408/g.66727  ORF Transcript_22408/g.66727 Transcript_22408/m.66727 type:complete len:344 (-) Transcript_22408:232-1263(-)